jgi:hypothetical protein
LLPDGTHITPALLEELGGKTKNGKWRSSLHVVWEGDVKLSIEECLRLQALK